MSSMQRSIIRNILRKGKGKRRKTKVQYVPQLQYTTYEDTKVERKKESWLKRIWEYFKRLVWGR